MSINPLTVRRSAGEQVRLGVVIGIYSRHALVRLAGQLPMYHRVINHFMGPGHVKGPAILALFLLPPQRLTPVSEFPADNAVALKAQLRQSPIDLASM